MFFYILSRWFRGRHASPQLQAVPSLPSQIEPLRASLEKLSLADHHVSSTDNIGFLFDTLPGSAAYALLIGDVPVDLEAHFQTLAFDIPGVCYITSEAQNNCDDRRVLHLYFSTSQEAAMAYQSRSTITVAGHRRHLRLESGEPTDMMNLELPAPKRAKIKQSVAAETDIHCTVCGDSLKTAYSRPCYYCRNAYCYQCLRQHFTVALTDQAVFPIECCRMLTHYDVARGVLPEADYERYKQRYEEFSTTKPIYCANSSCSTFLPPRIAKPENNRVCCPRCKGTTCIACRITVTDMNHSCTLAREHEAFMEAFNYKQCPRCNQAVAKMYGCSHMRCRCGAHWCWECTRPKDVCWRVPCDTPSDYGQANLHATRTPPSDDDEIPIPAEDVITITAASLTEPTEVMEHAEDIEINANYTSLEDTTATSVIAQPLAEQSGGEPTFASSHSIALPSLQETTVTTAPWTSGGSVFSTTNLDDEDRLDWENASYDFGDEPSAEVRASWGCAHVYQAVYEHSMSREWLPSTSLSTGSTKDRPIDLDNEELHHDTRREMDCHACYQRITLDITSAALVSEPLEVPPVHQNVTLRGRSIPAGSESNNSLPRRDSARRQIPKIFVCIKCGVFNCLPCKKTESKRVARLRLR